MYQLARGDSVVRRSHVYTASRDGSCPICRFMVKEELFLNPPLNVWHLYRVIYTEVLTELLEVRPWWI